MGKETPANLLQEPSRRQRASGRKEKRQKRNAATGLVRPRPAETRATPGGFARAPPLHSDEVVSQSGRGEDRRQPRSAPVGQCMASASLEW
eukprot:8373812-Pyramimonas_sp.AAC.1